MNKHDNPPAFPCVHDRHLQEGMTLRDWFAGQALSNPTICTGRAEEYHLRRWFGDRGGIMAHEIAAKQAHEYADAMLAERERQQ